MSATTATRRGDRRSWVKLNYAGRPDVVRTSLWVLGRLLIYVIIISGAALFMFPFAWMLTTSLKPSTQLYKWPPIWIPKPFTWSNYTEAWSQLPFAVFYKNTIVIAALNILGTLISCSLAAFGFARMRFRGREFLFLLVLSTMMLPQQVTMIPLYIIFARLKWIDTHLPLVVPSWFGSAFNIFLLRQFFMTIPHDLDEAALIDGASRFEIYWRIILPLSKMALGVVAIFAFIWNWNNFMQPLIYLSSQEKFTIQLGLRQFQSNIYMDMGAIMAMSVVALIPQLVAFFFAQKHFVQGVVMTGIKG
ncbi:MAG: carbohydrate ABC transporter permease [Anaerolineae bacterium]|nr:carbohydrate ABC transporter permease [Anaerolineae bacterium]